MSDWRKNVDAYLIQVEDKLAGVQHALTEALTAQEYQDLAGQAMRQVTGLIRRVEAELVALMRVAGSTSPAAESETSEERLQSQDEVDALLSSLGF